MILCESFATISNVVMIVETEGLNLKGLLVLRQICRMSSGSTNNDKIIPKLFEAN